ncbi:MAG: asparagine--tRNA ligase [Bacteriovoracaceae bacterium]|jgi:asparaginyl-tRNA synthetase|nr:asparagine--tRNA ligase [Halobacteriovoraceae bacterium]MDP7320011.1 asparagine--tRNA ligase [Bacteriovoracaceae bacterium]
MKRSTVKELYATKPSGQDILVKGWIRSIRVSKSFSFIVINDGSCQKDLQIIADDQLEGYEDFTKSLTGSAFAIYGKLVESKGKQPVEVHANSIEVLGKAPQDYPLQKKGTSMEFLREIAHLRPRTNTFGAVFRVRHELAQATHRFFSDKGFYYIHTPILTAMDAEGAGELFRVSTLDPKNMPYDKSGNIIWEKDYFGKESYLCVTGQLEAEAFACSMGSVYTFGPTFRSENSNTTRHLSEFWMIEPEVAFADLDEIALLGAEYIQYMIKHALKYCKDELEFFNRFIEKGLIDKLTKVSTSDFKQITYTEAVDILIKSNKSFDYPVEWGADLQTEHERYLTDEYYKGPVIVTDYPKGIKAFYMKQNDDNKTVRAMDILVPGVGEIIGGSQREEDLDKLTKRMKELNLEESLYNWYLDLRRFGSVPHSGFGLGFERAIMYITGMSNIRDVIPFYRTPNHIEF